MDIAIKLSGQSADLAIEGGDLALDHGLNTAVLISLFSDARMDSPELLPEGEPHPRGWWADTFSNTVFGSHLWILERGKLTTAVRNEIKDTMEAALAWIVDEGIADFVEVTVSRLNTDRLVAQVAIERGSATQRSTVWDFIEANALSFETPTLQVHLLTK